MPSSNLKLPLIPRLNPDTSAFNYELCWHDFDYRKLYIGVELSSLISLSSLSITINHDQIKPNQSIFTTSNFYIHTIKIKFLTSTNTIQHYGFFI